MHRILCVFVIILILFIITSCTDNISQDKSDLTTEVYEQQPSESTVTATPKSTLSEDEKRTISRLNEYLSYCRDHNDWYAAVLLKEMYDNGEITQEQFSELYNISAFENAKDFDDEVWKQIKDHLVNISSILNEETVSCNETDVKAFYNYLCSSAQKGTVYITLFNTQEKKNNIKSGIDYIRKWFKDPSEDNLALVKEVLSAEALSPGEVLFLGSQLYYNLDLPETISAENGVVESSVYLDDKGFDVLIDTAYNKISK